MKKLLVSGCSFSAGDSTWPMAVARKFDQTVNVAFPAAGNTYIANSISDYITKENFDMVLVMWSGYSRFDIPTQWMTKRLETYDFCVTKNRNKSLFANWLLSGGRDAGWKAAKDPDITELFQRIYLEIDVEQLAYMTLQNIINTQTRLEHSGIPYRFMSFINFWDEHRPNHHSKSFYYSDPPISEFPRLQPLVQQIKWNKWIFDSGYNGIYERCMNIQDLAEDGLHPGQNIQMSWAEKIIESME